MAFNIQKKDSPAIANSRIQQKSNARERAMAILSGNASPTNQNAVAPEEMASVTPPAQEIASAEVPSAPVASDAVAPKAAETTQETAASTIQTDNISESSTTKAESIAPSKDPLSSQYALLARKEKAYRAKMQELKAKEDAIKAQEDSFRAKEVENQSKFIPKERLTQDTLSVLQELGISYDQLTSMILNQPKPEDTALLNEIKALKAELASVKETQETSKKQYTEQQQESYKQAVNQIRHEVNQLVNSDESFETIKATNSAGDVVELIEKTFKEDGILLTVEEAAKEVEDYLTEEAMKLMKIKKIQSKFQPTQQVQTPPAMKPKTDDSAKQQQPQVKTLTNSVTSSRKMSARERAMLAFKGELK